VPLALVTGGTSGIGAAFADELAADGHDLVLVARGADGLAAAAASLRARHGVAVEILRADLTEPAGRAAVESRLTASDAPPVDVLVSNAGVQVRHEFLDADLSRLQTEVDVNISAVLRMAHLALTGMVARGHGSVILVSSFAGILPARGSAYGASRAWAIALADILAPTLQGTGVQITAVCPGFVRTPSLPGIPESAAFQSRFLLLSPEWVARRALADSRAGRTMSVPGFVYRAVWTSLDLPRRILRGAARLAGRDRGRPAAVPPRSCVQADRPTVPTPRRPSEPSPAERQPTR
jgi:short-subunit dehydrogenase